MKIESNYRRCGQSSWYKTFKNYWRDYYGLRLGYEKTLNLDNLVPPIDSRFTSEYPFTRNGFTSGNNGRLGIPEYVLDKRVSPKIGSEIWRIKPDGTEELRVFKEENNIERFYKIK